MHANVQNHKYSVVLLREVRQGSWGVTCEQEHALKEVRMDMEWIYFVSVRLKEREVEKQGVSWVLVQQDSHLKVSRLEG